MLVTFVKDGDGVLRDCKFGVWTGSVLADVRDPSAPFVIANGRFMQPIFLVFEAMPGDHSLGSIALICGTTGTQAHTFVINEEPFK